MSSVEIAELRLQKNKICIRHLWTADLLLWNFMPERHRGWAVGRREKGRRRGGGENSNVDVNSNIDKI